MRRRRGLRAEPKYQSEGRNLQLNFALRERCRVQRHRDGPGLEGSLGPAEERADQASCVLCQVRNQSLLVQKCPFGARIGRDRVHLTARRLRWSSKWVRQRRRRGLLPLPWRFMEDHRLVTIGGLVRHCLARAPCRRCFRLGRFDRWRSNRQQGRGCYCTARGYVDSGAAQHSSKPIRSEHGCGVRPHPGVRRAGPQTSSGRRPLVEFVLVDSAHVPTLRIERGLTSRARPAAARHDCPAPGTSRRANRTSDSRSSSSRSAECPSM